jgi:hypothetical protein
MVDSKAMSARDTTPEAAAVQVAIWQAMSGAERAQLAFDMSLTVRELALSGLRCEHPDWDEQTLLLELLRRWFPSSSLPAALR